MAGIDLTPEERDLLARGLTEWSGPATASVEIANLLDLAHPPVFLDETQAIARRIRAGEPLEPADWRRALLATEIVFASDVVGSGVEWSTTTGISDEDAIRLLRSAQRKLVGVVRAGL